MDHALARAAAFLPAQYSATRNVIGELNQRLGGGLVGPVLEVSGTLGAGLWATYDVAGPDAVKGFCLVHRTRHGLALAQRFADAIPVEKSFKRDFTFIEMQRPQVAMSTFALSGLPKKLNRIAHLNDLLSVGSDHIVLLERAGDEGWALMKEAREYLLRQSSPGNPLHIMAPCPGDGACPRANGKEACAFAQRLQRPPFLRKTKHGKNGEEIVAYTYLIVSRGERPVADLSEGLVGRMGAVGKEQMERLIAKEAGYTEVRPVEGGERGAYEVVDVPSSIVEVDNTDPNDPEVLEQLRQEAYAWPRLIAPTMKRSGHVVMDMCTKEGEIHRIRVAKSHGKQEYYDGRRLDWGDLYPHQPKGKTEIRTRGVRRLTKMDHEAEDMELEEILAAINSAPLEGGSDDAPTVKFEFENGEEPLEIKLDAKAKPEPIKAVEDEQFRSTGDAGLDELLKRLGATNLAASLVDEEAATAPSKSKSGRVTVSHSTMYEMPSNKRKYTTSARSFSTSAIGRGKEDDEFYFKEVVEEDCAPGEETFSRSSLSDPDYERPNDLPTYTPTRPKRPEQPLAANPNAEPAAAGEGGWSRWSLSDPPLRSDEDLKFYFRNDPEEDCAPGEEAFSRSSLSDPDYERPTDLPTYTPPRPKRPEVVENAEPAAAGEGGWASWSLSDPPYRGSKRGFSTMARPRVLRPSVSLSRSMSVAPAERTSGVSSRPKMNVGAIHAIYQKGIPITVLTAYDYPTSLLASRAGIDVILVGDSLAQVALGYPTTVPLTLDEMVHHVRAVSRGAGSSFVLVDIPFGYVEASVADGVKAATALMKAGADGLKIEGGREMLPLVRRLAETGIPVMSHIGLQPQRVASTGYKAQGRSAAAAVDLIETAKECEAAGAFALLLEAIPHRVATAVTQATGVPTIGIGAGSGTSGQVLVLTDMLATYDIAVEGEDDSFKVPKFVRTFANVGKASRRAVDEYIAAVRSRDFPTAPKETYAMPKEELEEFNRLIEKK